MCDLIELAGRHRVLLTAQMAEQFACYQRMLLSWNEKMNLTAITRPDEIVEKHFLDSLLLLAAKEIPTGVRWVDVGTGAGFPGIPLKIARPDIRLTLLDSLQKRTTFLTELSRELGQDNEVIHGRAEELAHDSAYREAFDYASARAVAALPLLCEVCLPYLREGGVFCAMKGPDSQTEAEAAKAGVALLGGGEIKQSSFQLPVSGGRMIYLIEKSSQTPLKYPRKFNQMTKKPL